MAKTRFLRDKMLDEMLDEIRTISDKIFTNEFSLMVFTNSMRSLAEMYETNKRILLRLEKVIETKRTHQPDDPTLDDIVEAAAHVQLGLVTIHNALKKDVNGLLQGIKDIESSLSLEEQELEKKKEDWNNQD